MSKIADAFTNKKAFIPFLTAGDPTMEATERYIKIMADAGADVIEIGIPFSDPVAEGPVIQEATLRSLTHGTTTDAIFDMVERVRPTISIPLVVMTYINLIYVYGADRFMARCKKAGICGVIVPDMPFEEKSVLIDVAHAHDIEVVSLIAPTSEERIGMIAKEAEGFVYCVSSMGVTGVRKEITTDVGSIVDQIKRYTDVPVAVGFGISTPEQAAAMANVSDGAIVGSAIVRIIGEHGDKADEALREYVQVMKAAVMF